MGQWILVVDDNTANLTMANHILTQEGMRVSCVKSGEIAVKFLQHNRPDLILLDIHMPGMDGFETLAAIQKCEGMADVPVLFLTADEDDGTQERGLKAGAAGFLKKPFVPDELLQRVKEAAERNPARES